MTETSTNTAIQVDESFKSAAARRTHARDEYGAENGQFATK